MVIYTTVLASVLMIWRAQDLEEHKQKQKNPEKLHDTDSKRSETNLDTEHIHRTFVLILVLKVIFT